MYVILHLLDLDVLGRQAFVDSSATTGRSCKTFIIQTRCYTFMVHSVAKIHTGVLVDTHYIVHIL